MPHDGLDLVFLFSVHHSGWRVVIVDLVLFCFVIGGQQRCHRRLWRRTLDRLFGKMKLRQQRPSVPLSSKLHVP